MEKERFRIKHPEILIIIFVISLVVTGLIFFFAYRNARKIDPGFYEITPNTDKEVRYYGGDFRFYYYYEDEDDYSSNNKNITDLYSRNLKEIYASLDEDNTYQAYVSIGQINENPNKEVLVTEDLYNTLKDAYEKTLTSTNYSIFASPLYAFWNGQISFDKNTRIANDPLNSEASRNYLALTSSIVNDRNNVDLEFLDGKVKLKVSDYYVNYRNENNIIAPYISLNNLKNAYILQQITNILNEYKMDKGYIVSIDGNVMQLRNCPVQPYNLFSVNNFEIYYIANITLEHNESSASSFRRFNLSENDATYFYHFTQDGVTYFRSLYIDIHTGLQPNFLFSSGIYLENGDILTKTYLNNEMARLSSIDEVKEFITVNTLNNYKFAFNTINEPKTIYINNSLKEIVKLNTDLDYNLYNLF